MKTICLLTHRLGVAGLLALALLGLGLGPAAAQEGGRLTVVAPALNVRQGPGVTYPAVAVLNQGQQLDILGHDAASNWWQVRLPNGTAGWVSGGPAYVSVGGAAATPAGSVQGGQPARSSRLVFQAVSGGPIYIINLDGSGLRYLADGIDPALSPDGQQVAFTRWDNPQNGALGGLWLINTDGSGERMVLGDIRQPKSPTWSPDGAAMAVSFQYGGRLQPEERCSSDRPPPGAYDISIRRQGPGDVEFCYVLPPRPLWGLRRVDVASGRFEDLPRDNFSYAPTWNPANSGQLVYSGERGLISLDLNTGVNVLLTADVQQHAPLFSPDGTRLAVTYRQVDHWEVHVLNADGSGQLRLTETSYREWAEQQLRGEAPYSFNNAAPAWSPDSRQIAFVTDRTGPWDIWVMNADGTEQRPLFPAGVLAGITLQYNGVDERMLSWR